MLLRRFKFLLSVLFFAAGMIACSEDTGSAGEHNKGDPSRPPEKPDPPEVVPLSLEISAAVEAVHAEEDVELTAIVKGDDAEDAEVTWSVEPNEGALSSLTGSHVTWTAASDMGKYTISATATLDTQTDTASIDIAVCGTGCIYTLEDLDDIRLDLAGSYIVVNDIDARSTRDDEDVWGSKGFEPIGSEDDPFMGELDGGGHTISGLFVSRPDAPEDTNVGLFGVTGSTAFIHDLHLEGLETIGTTNVGGLVGLNDGGHVLSVSVAGEVRGNRNTGGIVGYHIDGMLEHSVSQVAIQGVDTAFSSEALGGLVGYNESGHILRSFNEGIVKGYRTLGGLVGRQMDGGTIKRSYNLGEIVGRWQAVGGLVGRSEQSVVENSYNEGDVSGDLDVGGLIGYKDRGRITDSYNMGNVLAVGHRGENAGGLIGMATRNGGGDEYVELLDVYSTGDVRGALEVGGLVGHSFRLILTNAYSTGNVKNEGDQTGGIIGSAKNSTIINAYSENRVEGDGDNVGGLAGLIEATSDTPKMTITTSFSASSVHGENNVGGLVGHNEGAEISTSYALPHPDADADAFNVVGRAHVGGLVGYNLDEIVDSYSWNSVQVTLNYGGGLVGSNEGIHGKIERSYSIGTLDSTGQVGGLVGRGESSAVDASFWDRETSGTISSWGGTSGTTTQMHTADTFTDAGWDDAIWTFRDGEYPDLRDNPRE